MPTTREELELDLVAGRASELIREIKDDICAKSDARETAIDYNIRNSAWTLAAAPRRLANRRIEIMGPATVHAATAGMDSGANVYVADFSELAKLDEQGSELVIRELARIAARPPTSGNGPCFIVRPRELCAEISGRTRGSEGLSDLVLFSSFYAHFNELHGGPYFYLPDIDSRATAIQWNRVIMAIESRMEMAGGSIRTTAEICRPSGVAHGEEILWEHRRHSVGLGIRYVDDMVGATGDSVGLEGGGSIKRSQLRALVAMCERRGAQIICGVRKGVPLKAGSEDLTVALSRAVPGTKALIPA